MTIRSRIPAYAAALFALVPLAASAQYSYPNYYPASYGYGMQQQQQQQQQMSGGYGYQPAYYQSYYQPTYYQQPASYYPQQTYSYDYDPYWYGTASYYQPASYYGYGNSYGRYGIYSGPPNPYLDGPGYFTGDYDTFNSPICYFANYGRADCGSDPRQPVYDVWTGAWY